MRPVGGLGEVVPDLVEADRHLREELLAHLLGDGGPHRLAHLGPDVADDDVGRVIGLNGQP